MCVVHDRLRDRLVVILAVAGLLFTALAGRIVYLNEAFARVATSGGGAVDLEGLGAREGRVVRQEPTTGRWVCACGLRTAI